MANAQVRLIFIDSVRGGKHLYYSGHKYRINKKTDEKTYWKCVTSQCKAKLITSDDVLQSQGQAHNHVEEPFIMHVDAFKSKLVHRTKTEVTPIPITFSCSPKLFDQVYTIHAEFQEHMFPLVFCLLPNKAECTYVRAFEYIQEAAHNLGFDWTPSVFQLDFERAAHNAVQSAFATTHTRGCFFHFTQCMWRRVQKEGLATEYTSDEEFKKVVRRASALPLVPLDMVEDVWADAIADSPQRVKVTRFMDYVTTTWVEGSLSKDLWNHFGNQGRRTNNNLEGWHHHLNKSAQKTHPNIFEVVNLLKREQSHFCDDREGESNF